MVCKFALIFVELNGGLFAGSDFDLVENNCGDSDSK
jgi:hypothetical protein